ncbi:MAG: T9SS type A sorting domain-containing protein [Brumimicrobium sp.]|nr:T9SS type A sorting domain-containing protein [Brumimicrobium sp.]
MKQFSVFKFFILILHFGIHSQTVDFDEVIPANNIPTNDVEFDYTFFGEIEFADVDNDGDLDVIISGAGNYASYIRKITHLYLNDGNGNFELIENTPFQGVRFSTVDFADVNNDGAIDVLITGQNNNGVGVAELFLNDGIGNFQIVLGTPFEPMAHGSCDFGDIDNDGDLDLIISGYTTNNQRISKLYFNDGNGNYTHDSTQIFVGVERGTSSFTDLNNDGNIDLVISGFSDTGVVTLIYFNDGTGSFNQDTTNSLQGVYEGNVEIEDINNDGYPDILLVGADNSQDFHTRIYINDGNAFFTENTNHSLPPVWFGKIYAEDFNNDGVKDIIISGQDVIWQNNITELYINDGFGGYDLNTESNFEGVAASDIAIGDIDGNGTPDVLMNGQNNNSHALSRLYINNGDAKFTWASWVLGDGLDFGSSDFGDLNGDGYNDLVLFGCPSLITDQGITNIFFNDGDGNFIRDTLNQLKGNMHGDVKLFDFDNDGDKDIFLIGYGGPNDGNIAELYENDGNGLFSLISNTPFEPMIFSSIAVGDINNNGFQDVIICGRSSNNEYKTELYLNNNGSFTFENNPFRGVTQGSLTLADFTNNGELDLFITGYHLSQSFGSQRYSKLYINNGGTFNESTTSSFEGVAASDVAAIDIENDGDLDLLVSGFNGTSASSRLYKNDGSGSFTELSNHNISNLEEAKIASADFSGNGYSDIIITGSNNLSEVITELYLTDGQGGYFLYSNTPFQAVTLGTVEAFDINNDNKIDILLCGYQRHMYRSARLYKNTTTLNFSEWSNPMDIISVYPVPANQNITVDLNDISKSIHSIQIIDNLGRICISKKLKNENYTVTMDVSELNTGSYVVKVITDEESYSRKILISK